MPREDTQDRRPGVVMFSEEPPVVERCLAGGGEVGALLRRIDWSRTALGPVAAWPRSLQTMAGVVLTHRFPMLLGWGPQLLQIYNDACRPFLGDEHPAALGAPAAEVWTKVWDVVGPMAQGVLDGGPAVEREHVPVPIQRRGLVEEAYFTFSASPVPDDEGRAFGVLVTFQDVTAQRRAAIEREILLDGERAARAEAERANQIKDDFLATVSHELRTPLNAILGWANLLRRPGRGGDQLDKGLAVIERNARLQVQLISDLLDVSRILSGKLHVELAPVAIVTSVGAAVEAVRAAAAVKGVAIHEALAPTDATVRGDPARIQQIVTNLLSNAIKFTPRGGRVDVSVAARGGWAEIAVRDTGPGIAAEFLPHVFERFRQADTSTTRRHGGLGLGLAIVKHLVEVHGGTVRAESEGLGQGATFTVALPCEAGPEDTGQPPPISARAPSLRGVRLLVVDDEPDARDLTQRVLEEHGAAVVTAGSAEEALALIRISAPDVLVSDIGMPGMDGHALLQRIRAGGEARDVPALALSAFARAEDRERSLSAGYRAHLTKPVDPVELVTAVASLHARSAAPRK